MLCQIWLSMHFSNTLLQESSA